MTSESADSAPEHGPLAPGTAAEHDTRAPEPRSAAPAVALDEQRLHPAYLLIGIAKLGRALFPAVVALTIALSSRISLPLAVALVVVVIAAALALTASEWYVTRYSVVDGALRLRRGLLKRSERVIPVSRISALDTSRGLVQRAFGLVSVEVQTAGGKEKAEIELETVTFEAAERLRAAVGHAVTGASELSTGTPAAPADRTGTAADGEVHPADDVSPVASGRADDAGSASPVEAGGVPGQRPAPASVAPAAAAGQRSAADRPSTTVYAITPRELLVAALTGPQLGIVVVAVGALASQARELLPDRFTRQAEDTVSSADLTTIVAVAVVALLVAAVVAVVGTVLAFSGFTVVRDEQRLRIRRGLLTERTGSVPLDRFHGVRVVEGLLRRPLGYATVQVEVAGYRDDDTTQRTLVPLVHRDQVPALLARIVPELVWPTEALRRPPVRARRRYWTQPLLVALVPAAAALIWLPGAWRLVALLPLAVALAYGDARWRGAGWHQTAGTLTVRWQGLARTTMLLRPARIQHAMVRTTPFQRRAGLAAFDVVLATGHHAIARQLDVETASALQHAVIRRRSLDCDAPAGVAQSVRAAES